MPELLESASNNRFLRSLPRTVAQRLALASEAAPLARGDVLVEAGAAATWVYFPERGLISLVKPMSDGRAVEVGMVGVEGLTTVSSLLGVARSPFEAVVQLEGRATRCRTAEFRRAMDGSPALTRLVLRYMYFKLAQLAQTAACNRLHSLRQRCCRRLLLAHDNAGDDVFTLTHEFLALMMGVNRPSLTLVLAGLQNAGVIRYRRASVEIRHRARLEDGACECYRTLREELERVYAGSR